MIRSCVSICRSAGSRSALRASPPMPQGDHELHRHEARAHRAGHVLDGAGRAGGGLQGDEASGEIRRCGLGREAGASRDDLAAVLHGRDRGDAGAVSAVRPGVCAKDQPDDEAVTASVGAGGEVLRVALGEGRQARIACRPRRSGNMPAARERRRSSTRATRCRTGFQPWPGDIGLPRALFHGRQAAARISHGGRSPSARRADARRMPGAFTTCTATSPSGARDWYGPYEAAEQTDPLGRSDGDFRVIRGGQSFDLRRGCCARRIARAWLPQTSNDKTGFPRGARRMAAGQAAAARAAAAHAQNVRQTPPKIRCRRPRRAGLRRPEAVRDHSARLVWPALLQAQSQPGHRGMPERRPARGVVFLRG